MEKRQKGKSALFYAPSNLGLYAPCLVFSSLGYPGASSHCVTSVLTCMATCFVIPSPSCPVMLTDSRKHWWGYSSSGAWRGELVILHQQAKRTTYNFPTHRRIILDSEKCNRCSFSSSQVLESGFMLWAGVSVHTPPSGGTLQWMVGTIHHIGTAWV